MQRAYQQLETTRQGEVVCVSIRPQRLLEDGVEELGAEMARLIDEDGCRKIVLNVGPGDLDCLYSMFLAKLVNLQRRLEAVGGRMALAQASENTREVFRATGLERHFKFFPDEPAAVQALA
jgi:anti-anti-sigma factor